MDFIKTSYKGNELRKQEKKIKALNVFSGEFKNLVFQTYD